MAAVIAMCGVIRSAQPGAQSPKREPAPEQAHRSCELCCRPPILGSASRMLLSPLYLLKSLLQAVTVKSKSPLAHRHELHRVSPGPDCRSRKCTNPVASIKRARGVDATIAVGKSNVHQRDVGKVNGSMRDSLGSQGGSGADLVTEVLDEGSRYMRASSSTMRTFMCRGFAAAELSPPPPNCRDEGGGGGP